MKNTPCFGEILDLPDEEVSTTKKVGVVYKKQNSDSNWLKTWLKEDSQYFEENLDVISWGEIAIERAEIQLWTEKLCKEKDFFTGEPIERKKAYPYWVRTVENVFTFTKGNEERSDLNHFLITNGVALKAGQETNVDAISLIPEVIDDMKVNHVLMPEGGDLIQAPSLVTMHYTGRLKDGTVFDSSVQRNEPYEFKLGARKVISCWEELTKELKEGSIATFTCPHTKAYGGRWNKGKTIPPYSTLIFDIEVLKAVPWTEEMEAEEKAKQEKKALEAAEKKATEKKAASKKKKGFEPPKDLKDKLIKEQEDKKATETDKKEESEVTQ